MRRTRGTRLVVLLLMSILAVVGGIAAASRFLGHMQSHSTGYHRVSNPGPRGELRYDDHSQDSENATQNLLGPAILDPLSFNTSYEKLDHEPAGLPAYASPHSPLNDAGVHHERRYRIADGNVIDEVSFWRIDQDTSPVDEQIQAVLKHYTTAAAALGLTHRASPAAGGNLPANRRGVTALFSNPDDPARLLTVRLAPTDSQLHLTVWLRYAEPP